MLYELRQRWEGSPAICVLGNLNFDFEPPSYLDPDGHGLVDLLDGLVVLPLQLGQCLPESRRMHLWTGCRDFSPEV